jgi:NADH dehydrogenase [ubiquinone] 1 alpha subcomplex assembly factor 7
MNEIINKTDISPLEQIIRDKIAHRGGAINVAEFMEYALGHEQYGYYMNRDPFGEHGDFITAPEISQIFGEMMGVWLAAMWQMMGEQEMLLLEIGGGRGTLMADALRATRNVNGFHESLVIVMVDASPMMRRFQRANIGASHPRISWQQNLDNLPDLPLLFVANEFFDALPIRQYVKTGSGLCERMVSIDPITDKLTFSIQQMGLKLVKGGAHYAPDNSADGLIIESSPVSRQIADNLAAHMEQYGGAGVIIDYGYRGESRGNTLQAVKQHGFWHPLQSVGEADITANVAFDELAELFTERKLQAEITTQGEFLRIIGGGARLNYLLENASESQQAQLTSGYERLIDKAQMGELFKVLGVCSDAELTMAGFHSYE